MAFRALMGADFPELMWQIEMPARGTIGNPIKYPVWCDVTPWVRNANDSLGRGSDIGQPGAGVSTIVLDNRQSLFSPGFGSEPDELNSPWDHQGEWFSGYYGQTVDDVNLDPDGLTTTGWLAGANTTISAEPDDHWNGDPDKGSIRMTQTASADGEMYRDSTANRMFQASQYESVLLSCWVKAEGYYSEGSQTIRLGGHEYSATPTHLQALGVGPTFTLEPGVWTRVTFEATPTHASCARIRLDVDLLDPPGSLLRSVLVGGFSCIHMADLGGGVVWLEPVPSAEQWLVGEHGKEASIKYDPDQAGGGSAAGGFYNLYEVTNEGPAEKTAWFAVYIPSGVNPTRVYGELGNFGSTGVDGSGSKHADADLGIRDEWQFVRCDWTHTSSDVSGTWHMRADGVGSGDVLYHDFIVGFDEKASPFAGAMRPMNKIRCLARWPQGDTGETFPVFEHYIEAVDVSWPGGPNDEVVTITAVDATKVINLASLEEAYERKVASDGASAYWKMSDVELDDASGEWRSPDEIGDNHIVVQGGASWGHPGAISSNEANKSMMFSPATTNTDLSTVADDDALDVGDGPFTIECWYSPMYANEAYGSAAHYVVQKGTNGPSLAVNGAGGSLASMENLSLGYGNAGTLAAGAIHRSAWKYFTSGVEEIGDVTDPVWYHIVHTVDGSTHTAYINGVDQTIDTTARTWASNSTDMLIGDVECLLDELAIYKSALTATQVRDHYALAQGQFPRQMLHERVQLVLDIAGWEGGRIIDSSKTRLPAGSVGGGSCWSYIQQLAETEGGLAYIDGRGRVVFENRDHRLVEHGEENVVRNPGAEGATTTHWTTDMTLVASSDEAHTGTRSFKGTSDGAIGWLMHNNITGTDNNLRDLSGYTRYFMRVRVWVGSEWDARAFFYGRDYGTTTTEMFLRFDVATGQREQWVTWESPWFRPEDKNNDGYCGIYDPDGQTAGRNIYIDTWEIRPYMTIFQDVSAAAQGYAQIVQRMTDQRVFNRATVTPSGGAAITLNDSTSQDLANGGYGIRVFSLSSLAALEEDARGRARQVIHRHKDPETRLDQIVVQGGPQATSLWPTLLRSHLGERIRIQRTTPAGDMIDEEYHVEQIQHNWQAHRQVQVTLQVSPADVPFDNDTDLHGYWQLGHQVFGRLNEKTTYGVH